MRRLLALLVLLAALPAQAEYPGPQGGSRGVVYSLEVQTVLKLANGTTGSPALAFTSATTTGLYRDAAGTLVLQSATAATGGTDISFSLQSTIDVASADYLFYLGDSASSSLFRVSGAGAVTAASFGATGFYGGGYRDSSGVVGMATMAAAPIAFTSSDAADGAMTAFTFDTTATAATTDKLLSVKNAGVEKLYVAPNGTIFSSGAISASGLNATGYLPVVTTFSGTAVPNLGIYSAANAVDELGVTVGTSATTTDQTNLCVANDVDGTPICVLKVIGTGDVIATGGIQPGGITAAAPVTATTFGACAVGLKGRMVYVDDSDDTAVSFMCFCGTAADDSTYAWRHVEAPGTACP